MTRSVVPSVWTFSLLCLIAGHMQLGSMPGWRFAFIAVALLSVFIGGLTLWLGQEPRKLKGPSGTAMAPKESDINLADIAGHMLSVMRIPTFGLIVAQASMQHTVSFSNWMSISRDSSDVCDASTGYKGCSCQLPCPLRLQTCSQT